MIKKRWVAAATVAAAAWAAPAASAIPVYGLTDSNALVAFDSATPGTSSAPLAITGLQAGENVVGIDVRPATLQLYALGSTGRLYRVDTVTGAATQIGVQQTLTGTNFDIDFNPTVDRLRVVSDGEQNLRINPNTGAAATVDTPLSPAGNVTGAAYTSNAPASSAYPNPPATTLLDIDTGTDQLLTQTPPNDGTLTAGKALGVDFVGDVGFDISTTSTAGTGAVGTDTAYVVGRTTDTNDRFYTVNTTTGATTLVGEITSASKVKDIAVSAPLPQIAVVYTPSGAGAAQTLVTYRADRPASAGSPVTITGTGTERIIGIDRRPAGGAIYAVTDASKIYTLNLSSGQATPVLATAFSPTLTAGAAGIDFNPIPDAIRAVNAADQNLRLSPTAGTATMDTALTYAAGDPNAAANPNVTGAGYTNPVNPVPAATTLFDIDSGVDALAVQGATNPPGPNGGVLTTVGSLGLGSGAALPTTGGIEDGNGFDIAARFNQEFGAFQTSTSTTPLVLTVGAPTLYGVNVASSVPAVTTPPTPLAAANGNAVAIGALAGAPANGTIAGMTIVQDNILPAAPTPVATATATYAVPTATYVVPTVTPTPTTKITPGLSIKVKPKNDKRKPFKFTVSGKLNPKSKGRSACGGKIKLTAKKGSKTIGKGKASIKSNCTYKKAIKLTKKAGKRGTAKITAKFGGNSQLKAKSAKAKAKYGKKKRKK